MTGSEFIAFVTEKAQTLEDMSREWVGWEGDDRSVDDWWEQFVVMIETDEQ